MSMMPTPEPGSVVAVNCSATHTMSKPPVDAITLRVNHGVEGDAHAGTTDQHLYHRSLDPDRPNLRQVHLIHAELHDDLAAQGMPVTPGAMGENVTTRGVDLLNLPRGTRLHLGAEAVIEVTGLRNPCKQLNALHDELLAAMISRRDDGSVLPLTGVMSIVVTGGTVRTGDAIRVELPSGAPARLEPV